MIFSIPIPAHIEGFPGCFNFAHHTIEGENSVFFRRERIRVLISGFSVFSVLIGFSVPVTFAARVYGACHVVDIDGSFDS